MSEGVLRQPRVAGLNEGDRFPEPIALFFGEVEEKGEEVAFVAAAQGRPQTIAPPRGIGLVEEDDFRADCGQAPGGLLDTLAQRQGNEGLAAKDPVAAGALVDLNIEVGVVRAGVDVGGEIEAAAVPGLTTVVRDVVVVADQLPAGEVIEDSLLIVLKDGEIQVGVVAGLAAETGVDGPAAAKVPTGTEGGHEVGDAGEGFWDGCQGQGIFHHASMPNPVAPERSAPRSRSLIHGETCLTEYWLRAYSIRADPFPSPNFTRYHTYRQTHRLL